MNKETDDLEEVTDGEVLAGAAGEETPTPNRRAEEEPGSDPAPSAALPETALESNGAPAGGISILEQKLQEQTAKAAENWDKLLRARADFENFKKRMVKERADTAKYAQIPLLEKLLTVLDNFEMALTATGQAKEESVQSLKTGISMIFQQLKAALTEAGLSEVDAQGQPFDPNLHEAVMQQETSEMPEGHVVQQLRKGYKLHDRLLRPASVVVAKAPTSTSSEPDASTENQAPV